MKTFLRYALGVILALIVIYFWPVPRTAKAIHLWENGTFENPSNVSTSGDSLDFEIHESSSVTRHIHWHGSYWIDYERK